MGQQSSKSEDVNNMNSRTDVTQSSRRRRGKRSNSCRINLNSINGLESYRNIDNVLSEMGVTSVVEGSSDIEDSSDSDEVSELQDITDLRNQVQQLYDKRLNRFKARLSQMYPEQSQNGSVNVSRFRSATMSELISYIDLPTQLQLKQTNRYFRKLITISHHDVSLSTRTGWVDVIHLSSFLQRIRLYGEPRERDLKSFTQMIENDSFIELKTLELHHIGEWALIEILEALCKRVERAIRIGVLDESIQANLLIRETDFTPYFANRFAQLVNSTLYRILTGLCFVVQSIEGMELIIKDTQLAKCSRLTSIDFSGVSLLRHGFEHLVASLWNSEQNEDVPRLSSLNFHDTGFSNNCLVTLVTVINRGYLSNLSDLNLSANRISCDSLGVFTDACSLYLLPNLRCINLSDNAGLGNGQLKPFFIQLQNGVCPVIEEIHFNHCGLIGSDMEAFCAFLSSPFSETLRVIDLGNNAGITVSLQQFFRCLSQCSCKHLELLNMEGVNMGVEVLPPLKEWLSKASLTKLHTLLFNNNCLDQACFYGILKYLLLSTVQQITLLDVSSNLIGDLNPRSWDQLVYKRSNRSLCIQCVDFSHNPLTNKDMQYITLFLHNHTKMEALQEATFEDNNISAKGIGEFLTAFPTDLGCELSRLQVVSLSLRTIGRELNMWLCSPAASNVRKLVLTNCNLCKMDLTYLINAFEISKYCKKLQILKLSGNYEVNDDFVSDFIRIYSIEGVLPMIYELDLMYTGVTKVGAYAFLNFFEKFNIYSLRRLNLAYTQMSEHRVEILFQEFKKGFKGGVML